MRLRMTFDIIMKEGQLLKNRSRRERVRRENLKAHRLPAPKEWTDLARPEYHGHLVISAT